MVQISTRLLSSQLNKTEENLDYSLSWLAFRKYSGENAVLCECIKEVLRPVSPKEHFTLIDIGCGDATLTQKLIAEKIFKKKPGLVHFLEPSVFLKQRALKSLKLISSSGILYRWHSRLPRYFDLSINHNSSGLVLVAHSSYYFDDKDIEFVAELRKQGFRILLIENEDNCWVSRMMQKIGNNSHPQFDQKRFFKLVDALGFHQKEIILKMFPVKLRMPSNRDINKMLGFFTYGQVNSTYFTNRELALIRFKKAFTDELTKKTFFAYRAIFNP